MADNNQFNTNFWKKKMRLGEFVDEGYLQELNRCFLHPLGLALSVVLDTNTGEYKFGDIIDHRIDPAGIEFAAITEDEAVKAERIEHERRSKLRTRNLRYKVGDGRQPFDFGNRRIQKTNGDK